jgi:hypothetical protein
MSLLIELGGLAHGLGVDELTVKVHKENLSQDAEFMFIAQKRIPNTNKAAEFSFVIKAIDARHREGECLKQFVQNCREQLAIAMIMNKTAPIEIKSTSVKGED